MLGGTSWYFLGLSDSFWYLLVLEWAFWVLFYTFRLASSLGEGEYLSVESEQEEDYLIPLQVHYYDDDDDDDDDNGDGDDDVG